MRGFGFLAPFLASQACLQRGVVLYVDPCIADTFDDRLRLTEEACESRGVGLVKVWSSGFATHLCTRPDATDDEVAEVTAAMAPAPGEEAAWAAERLGASPVLGVCCGSDGGLGCSERLLNALAPTRSNGLLNARRDKFVQHEALRSTSLHRASNASSGLARLSDRLTD
tara:strand:+ start:48 stop:554 length:507 start_codon:yes stop_codon:yes gene_type:complete